ncbi:hypothetical protein [Streptomyces sp. ITFR-16]|uniref:hypothetical protein n=1 Tax=Streptomyces sp. ITFR-16 TaxID=3075198 RepID=UPI00288B86CE|nr:hypothetical protein [Streptomyces sp. ITFR-16]WNI24305.1 hypothetical protein RLT58_21415 [Streptomyces sp. ITFR-16]
MSWREAAFVTAVCWAASGLGYGVIAALDEPQWSVAPLIGMGLGHWFFTRHRSWWPALAAVVAGSATLFGLVDALRPELGRHAADALAGAASATVALAVFTLVDRAAGRVRGLTEADGPGARSGHGTAASG